MYSEGKAILASFGSLTGSNSNLTTHNNCDYEKLHCWGMMQAVTRLLSVTKSPVNFWFKVCIIFFLCKICIYILVLSIKKFQANEISSTNNLVPRLWCLNIIPNRRNGWVSDHAEDSNTKILLEAKVPEKHTVKGQTILTSQEQWFQQVGSHLLIHKHTGKNNNNQKKRSKRQWQSKERKKRAKRTTPALQSLATTGIIHRTVRGTLNHRS